MDTSRMDNSTQHSDNYTSDVGHTFPPFDLINPDDGHIPDYAIAYIILETIVFVPTIFGNTLLLTAFVKFKHLRVANSYIMIGNLAVADLLMGLVCLPVDILLTLLAGMSQDRTYCLIHICLVYVTIVASVMNLCLLSVERFHAIVFPFKHVVRFTKKRVYMMISVTWVAVVLVGCLPLMGWNEAYDVDIFECKRSEILPDSYQKLFHVVILAASLTNCVCFLVITRITLRKAKCMIPGDKSKPVNSAGNPNIRRDMRHTHVMLLISGLFAICWGPFCIISLVPRPSERVLEVRKWFMALGVLNSCLNWMVYGIKNYKFRLAFVQLLCRSRRKGSRDITTLSR